MRRSWLLVMIGLVACGGPPAPRSTGAAAGPARPPVSSSTAPVSSATTAPATSAAPSAAPPPAAPETQAPVTLLGAAPDARWLAYCAAERDTNGDGRLEVGVGADGRLTGDALEARLLVGGGTPRAIDELVESDPLGRHVIVRAGERYLLLDTQGGGELDLTALGADLRVDTGALPGHRALAFDHAGTRLAYLRGSPQGVELVLRSLSSGSETVLPTALAEIHRLEIAAGDHYAVLSAVAEDTNKNGRFDWPLPVARAPRRACDGPLPRIAARYPTGDKAVKVLVPLAGGKAELTPDLITPLGAALVRRAPSGELVLSQAGKSTMLAPAQCAGRLLHADAARQLVLLGCAGKRSPVRAEVELAGPGFRLPLKAHVQLTELDAAASSGERLVPVYPGADSLLVDLETRDVHPLEPGDLVIAVWGSRALVRQRQALRLYDATSRTFQKLDATLTRLPDVIVSGRFAYVAPALIDLETGRWREVALQRPLALSNDGRLLLAEGGAPSAERLARGPLRWE